MAHYQPTYGARETGRNVRAFVRANKAMFWSMLKPLMAAMLMVVAFELFFLLASGTSSMLFSLLYGYLYMALAVNWHRAVILGPNSYTAVDLINPRHNEMVFLGMMYGIPVLTFLICMGFGIVIGIAGMLHPAVWVVGSLLIVGFSVWLTLRWSFYFPARAVNTPITLKEAYNLSRGYVWKMICAHFFATWRITLLIFGLILLPMAVGFIPLMFEGWRTYLSGTGEIVGIMFFVVLYLVGLLPVYLYMLPLLSVMWVNILSNYYLHAKRAQITKNS